MKNSKLIIGGIVVAIIIVAVISFGSSSTSEAQGILDSALSNQYELNSTKYKGNLSIDIDKGDGFNVGADIELSGSATDLQDPEKQKSEIDIKIIDNGAFELGGENSVSLSIKTEGQVVYLKLNSIDAEGMPFDLSAILEKWVKIDDLSEQASAISGQSSMGLTPGMGAMDKEQLEEIQKIVVDSRILEVTKDLGIEDGAYHFAYRVDIKKAFEMVLKISELTDQPIDQEEIAAVKEELSKISKYLKPAGEIWIDQDLLQLKRLTMNLEIPKEVDDLPGPVSLSMDMQLLELNGNVEIEIPADTLSFEEAFGLVMASMFDFTAMPSTTQ